ncbi:MULTISPECIES: BTAD domain-containing putative transcriptional regulator [Mycobacterium]|uniref:Regulator n=1 Tax=Mycobacterium colombiense TaxID=339268 RepID=A0A329LW50_9MYCO|nr:MULTISPECIES: BTAD domain-containing putative transcriptional regulator [Mycobacterium]MDM4142531.1 BTAD domain-containing putative transcriptional regulator [Mycobacterium sp. FLAC0960]RAV11440.1 regulator [Mycobacterium colombiense]
MELGVLGPLQVRQGGAPVAIPGAKPRAILTMLGLHGGSVVPADALVELLWGEEPPRTAAKALQTHISSIRRALGDGFVLTQGAGWVLGESQIDASRYKSAARLGRDAAAAGDTSQAVARFEEALALWRGIPELPDGRRGTSEKTRWIESHAALVEDRADALLATGRAAEVIGDLEAAVAEAPLRERRWGQLMLALYRAGRQGEALGAYQRARSLLADELGVDPGPNLRRLEAAIVAQDASLDIAVAQHAPSVTRAVTFLLTDIEGSTAAWEADAEAMAAALARHDELVEQVVTSRGGRLIKTRGEGDATFSVFDRPSAAASAAVELQDAIAHEPWASRDPIRVRMALHTGEVELRDGDYFGRAVNRVARLRSLAQGGQILCSGATAELVIDTLADDVVLTDLGMRQLKNLARPEHVFELRLETGVGQPESRTPEAAPLERPGLPAVLVGAGPFVGRGRELDGLLAAWQAALTAGVRTVLIAGEPGVGKTRLAGEWSQRAYQLGAIVLYGRCDEDLGAPYQPFAEALRSLAPCMGVDRLRGLRGVEALLSLVPGLADVVPDLVRPAHSDPDTERYALFDAVVALLEAASTSAPVLLVLDDLHWAAKPTLLLLRHLLRFGEHARVQIVGTYRSTDLDRAHPLAAMLADLHRDGTANRLSLGGLDEDDVTTYVAEAGYDDEELAHALASVTGGNPFFLIQALRHVDESGGVWDQSTLPQGVREAVSRRLSRLPGETNKALAAAAVVGSRFALELVEQVVGTDLVDAFDEARQAGIVIEESGGFYRFNHAIVRQSLLAELASVRRMRLHQRIATTLETLPGADDELLAELAHHYFECAWAGNAAKAVFYCRRAADQAMARLAYEGAADLYHRALHALEEIDDELPDRDDQTVELLVARCEALLAAGDVASAAGAVSQLQAATVDSARLAAWATCFDGQLSMLIHPERLDEVEAALGDAAAKLAELDDAAGEAKAHTVRAGCLARLGRIGDSEVALDDALTAARRAREHRRVNAVLAGAPLAALWGPNPVPRAGGRCLDVVRLLRITTDSPAVEATSTRCQAVLEAFRGRTAAARRMIDSARRTVTELGLRHALLEVEQFAGIVELIGNDPAAAETHLRKAYNGFRRMGLDADTAETAALLGRACLALDCESEASELCAESERLAGHALKASIAWRTLRAHLLARGNDYDAARQVAQAAVTLAERTDALVDHGDACLTLATVLGRGGDVAAARAAAEQAVELYDRKGAAALADMARDVLGERAQPARPASPPAPVVQLDSECVRVGERVMAAVHRGDWDEFERLFAPNVSIENRRKIVGVPLTSDAMRREMRRELEKGATRIEYVMVAARGERLALSRLITTAADDGPGAPQSELLQLYAIDENGQVVRQVWFDVEDMDAAIAELDAEYARLESEQPTSRRLENAATRVYERLHAHFAARDWDAITELLTDDYYGDDRRSVVGAGTRRGPAAAIEDYRSAADIEVTDATSHTVATRGGRLALSRARYSRSGPEPDAFHVDFLQIVEIDSAGRIAAMAAFDLDDFNAAVAELDRRYLVGEAAPHARTWSAVARSYAALNRGEPPLTSPDCVNVDHRHETEFGPGDVTAYINAGWDAQQDITVYAEQVHRLSDTGAVITYAAQELSAEGLKAEWRGIAVFAAEQGMIHRTEVFGEADIEAAIARFEELHRPAPQLENAASRVFQHVWSHFAAGDWNAMAETVADDYVGVDHRRVVGAEIQHGRDDVIRDLQAAAEVGFTISMVSAIAIRGERLVLARSRAAGRDPGAVQNDALNVVEVDADARIARVVSYDLEDFDAAVAELDARYMAGEAAAYSQPWSAITRAISALNQREMLPTTAEWVNVDHRHGPSFAPGELHALLSSWNLTHRLSSFIEAVHRLNGVGAVVTTVSQETSREGLDAEWRAVSVVTIAGDLIDRSEFFDESGLDAAIVRFEQLTRPVQQPENAASRANQRFQAWFAARDWMALAEGLADNVFHDDRRRVVGMGVRRGRDAMIAEIRALVGIGVMTATSDVIATRGQHVVLSRVRTWGRDRRPEAFHTDALEMIQIDADEKIVARVVFDVDDPDAAFEEIDARYVAGEAATYADTWALITAGDAALNRYETPAHTEDWVNIDHRRATAFAQGELIAYMRAGWDFARDITNRILAVHRLTDRGAVVTHLAHGTLQNGSDVEWREVILVTFDGDLCNRSELFDEADLGTAIARFEQLSRPAPQLDNAASQVAERFFAYFAALDWDAVATTLALNVSHDDRRRVVNAGVLHGRDAQIANLRAIAEVGISNFWSTVLATRGARLALIHTRSSGPDRATAEALTEELGVVEIDSDTRMVAYVTFDADDFDAAIAELDARYLAGEAAAHADTWSAVAGVHAMFNRHEYPPEKWVTVDHRQGTPFTTGDMTSAVYTLFDLTPDFKVHIEAVHEINRRGAVITNYAHGSSLDGLGVEWRMVMLLMVDDGRLTRCEVFDETDPDAAIARLKELSRPASRLENRASRAVEQFLAHFAARDWDAMAGLLAEDVCSYDRRSIINAGIRRGRDAEMTNWRATASVWSRQDASLVATRGERLALFNAAFASRNQSPEAFSAAALCVVEIDDDDRIARIGIVEAGDIDAAFEELETRYLADEAVAHAQTWSAVARAYAGVNRHEKPGVTTDSVYIDHRAALTTEPEDLGAYFAAVWDLMPDVSAYIEAVHRLSDAGAVITHVARGASQEGFEAEWRTINVGTVEGDQMNRVEVYDESDLDAAIARFEELNSPSTALKNAASQAYERICEYLSARDWDALAGLTAENISVDDRRRVANAGIITGRDANIESTRALAEVGFTLKMLSVIATRGARLALVRVSVSGPDPEGISNDVLNVIEIDSDGRVATDVIFDLEDIDTAFAELESLYVSGEAANYAAAWSVIIGANDQFNRHALPTTTQDPVYLDHRPLVSIDGVDLARSVGAMWDLTSDANAYIEAVHQLSGLGAVITQVLKMRSQEGFDAELRLTYVITVEGDLLSRIEVFDETDLDAALARFEELSPSADPPENAASRRIRLFWNYFVNRRWDSMAEILANNSLVDDRRRIVNAGRWHGRDAVVANMRALAEAALDIGVTVVATRGDRLALYRESTCDPRHEVFGVELLTIVEIDTDERITAHIAFDVDDIDTAYAELETRYLAGEANDCAHAWSLMTRTYAGLNRYEMPTTTPDFVNIDHRRGITFEPGNIVPYVQATWDIAPDLVLRIETVHRLTNLGSVITHTARGTSQEGFQAEWRETVLMIFEGNLVKRCEMFDETDVETALARFDELHRPARRLENAASRAERQLFADSAVGDWGAVAQILADDSFVEDRRRVVNVGFWGGRDAVIANMRALERGLAHVALTVIATRGECLALIRVRSFDPDMRPGEFVVEILGVVETDLEDRIAAHVFFGTEDIDAGFDELDARYLAGEGAAYSGTWSTIAESYAALNRGQLPPTTPGFVDIDHRRGAARAPGELIKFLRSALDQTPDLTIRIAATHRLNQRGAIVTHAATGTSPEGFEAEWREVSILAVDGEMLTRCEVFDETDLDAALARFDELTGEEQPK